MKGKKGHELRRALSLIIEVLSLCNSERWYCFTVSVEMTLCKPYVRTIETVIVKVTMPRCLSDSLVVVGLEQAEDIERGKSTTPPC